MSNMQLMPFLVMVHCGRRRYEKRVKSIEDINEDDNVEDVKDNDDDVVEEKQQKKRRRKLVEDQVTSSMNADADTETLDSMLSVSMMSFPRTML